MSLRRTGRGPALACAKRGGGGQGTLSPQSPVRISPWVALPLAAWSPPGGQGSDGPVGEPGPDGKEAGSPPEEPHLSFHEGSSKRLLTKFGFSSFWINKSIFNKTLSF